MPATTDSDPTSALLRVLADPSRRAVLRHLQRRDDSTPTVEAVARSLGDDSSRGPPADERLALRHVHLPKLADAGLVAYDPVAGTVQYRGDPTAERLLQFLADEVE